MFDILLIYRILRHFVPQNDSVFFFVNGLCLHIEGTPPASLFLCRSPYRRSASLPPQGGSDRPPPPGHLPQQKRREATSGTAKLKVEAGPLLPCLRGGGPRQRWRGIPSPSKKSTTACGKRNGSCTPPCGARKTLRAYADPCVFRPLRIFLACFICHRQRKPAIPKRKTPAISLPLCATPTALRTPCRNCRSRACFATARQRRGCGKTVLASSATGGASPLFTRSRSLYRSLGR